MTPTTVDTAIPHTIEPCACEHSRVLEQIACDGLDLLVSKPFSENPAAGDLSERIAAALDAIQRGHAERTR